ncbi:hypothetical protein GCM10022389_19900 [Flavobacterium cheonanense]|uniref:Flagellar assembly protein T N-terminal domain-containing protein n=1 Tax=Flavobacterium cheonanense TaxID=706183 RepID=A0ABP7VU09_9FLAO
MKTILSIFFLLIFSFSFSNTIDDTSITITTIGNGATFEKARESALFSAITQVCGVYLSQDLKINNDEVVKEEITSITKGNIEKYSILSEVKIENGDCVSTLKVIVSVFKLKTYMESKGYKVEFNGAAFAMNVKLEKLNEEAEQKVVLKMSEYLDNIIQKSFDYEIKANNPEKQYDNLYKIPIFVTVKPNLNFANIPEFLTKTLEGISLQSGSGYPITIRYNGDYNKYLLRNSNSIKIIYNIILSFKSGLTNFVISDGIKNKTISNFSNNNNSQINDIIVEDNLRIAAFQRYKKYVIVPSLFDESGVFYLNDAYIENGFGGSVMIDKKGHNYFPNINRFTGVYLQFDNITNDDVAIIFKFEDLKSLAEISNIKEYSIRHK